MPRMLAALAALFISFTAPATAQESQEGLAQVLSALAGAWEGEAEVYNVDTGRTTSVPQSFSVAILGASGLDFAFWDADRLAIAIHQGGGAYNRRGWVAGALTEEYPSTMAVSHGAGGGSLIETYEALDETGAAIRMREEWTVDGEALSARVYVERDGEDGEPVLFFSGEFARVP